MKILEAVTFNTGNRYTAEGQPITAFLADNGETYFKDWARGIDGKISPRILRKEEESLNRFVWRAYNARLDEKFDRWNNSDGYTPGYDWIPYQDAEAKNILQELRDLQMKEGKP